MTELLATVTAYVCFGGLLYSGVTHARHPRLFRELVAGQRIWPSRLTWVVVGAVTAMELAVGTAGVIALVRWEESSRLIAVAGLSGAVLYGVFGIYAAYLLRRRPGAPCACSGLSEPTNAWTVVRAAIFAASAAYATAAADSSSIAPELSQPSVTAMLAGLALGLIVWNLPASLADPVGVAP